MPAHRKHDIVTCQYFRWRLFRRDGVWYADGRLQDQNLGKHSLATRDAVEARTRLTLLDVRMAVRQGLARETGVDPDRRTTITRGWDLYLTWCARPPVMGGVSPGTLRKYHRSRVLHEEFCDAGGIRHWNDFGKSQLERYGRRLSGRFAERSLYFELTQIKTVMNWLIGEKHLPGDAGFRFRLSKPDGSDTWCYTPEQVAAMLQLCRSEPDLHWLGHILLVLAGTGLRIGELTGLRWSDIDAEHNVIRLTDERASRRRNELGTARRTKGRRDRTIPLHPTVRTLLAGLPRHRHGRVLCTARGGKLKADRIRPIFVDRVIKPLTARFPSPEGEPGFAEARFHSFRHYFISQSFIGGATEAEIMDWVGHRDSKTVMIYRHLRNEDSQRRMQQIDFGGLSGSPDGPASATGLCE